MSQQNIPDARDHVLEDAAHAMVKPLADIQLFKESTEQAQAKNRVEVEKSKGLRVSKTVDGLPRCGIVGECLDSAVRSSAQTVRPLTPDQLKAAEREGEKLADKFANPLIPVLFDDIRTSLYGKTEEEIKAISAAFLKQRGDSIEEALGDYLDGEELSKARELVSHKDKDLVALPEGVDRSALVRDNAQILNLPDIHTSSGVPGTYPDKIDPKALHKIFEGKTSADLQAMNMLFKDCHGVTLEDYLQKHSFDPLGSLDKYVEDANKAKAVRDGFPQEVAKVNWDKIAEAAKALHDATSDKAILSLKYQQDWQRPNRGDFPAEKAIRDLTPAELEALKRKYKEDYGQPIEERIKGFDGSVAYVGESLERILERPIASNVSRMPVEHRAELREAAQKVWYAFEKYDTDGTDEAGFYKIMEGRSPAERAAICEYYKELTGRDLVSDTIGEFEDDKAELEKALNYLLIGSQNESANMYVALMENNAAHAIERVTTLTAEKLAATDAEFKERYGKSVREVIQANKGMTEQAKEALLIYIDSATRKPDATGRRLTDEEYKKVIDLSLHAKFGGNVKHSFVPPGDVKMFQNIMAGAPPHIREQFLKEGGESRIEAAFPDDGSQGDALEFAKHGRLSTERKLHKCDRVDDDEPGIVKALATMPEDERASYIRGARVYKEKTDTSRLTADQLKDYQKFQAVNVGIDNPADDEEHRDWRDQAIFSGGVDKAKEFINQISWKDLQDLKVSEEVRKAFLKKHNLDLLSEHGYKQVKELLEKRISAEKPEDLKYASGKSIADVLKLNDPLAGFEGDAKKGQSILEGIMQMPLADQRKYHADATFRERVNERVKAVLSGAQEEAALHMLASVEKGGYPIGDWIDNINIEAGKEETNERQVIRIVEEEFRKSEQKGETPTLRERVTPGGTHFDQALADRLDKALHRALESDEYEKWAKPVLSNGKLGFAERLQLTKEDGTKEDVYKDVQALAGARDAESIAERQRLATDDSYRQQVLGHLSANERALAEKILKQSVLVPAQLSKLIAAAQPAERPQILQRLKTDESFRQEMLTGLDQRDQRLAIRVLELGPVLPEDAVRAYRIGAQPSKDEMLNTLRAMNKNASQEADLKAAYADAYHEDIGVDLADVLKGKDARQVERLIRSNPTTARELYFRAMEEAESVNSGFGARVTRRWGSQAGDLAEDSARQLYARITKAAERGEEVSPEDKELVKLAEDAAEYTEVFIEAKQKAADALVDLALGVATIAVPGGMSLRLLMFAAGGGMAKVAMKSAFLGEHYDGEVLKDFCSGAVDAAFSALGPGQIAKACRLGEKAAVKAVNEVAESSAKGFLRTGGQELLEKEMKTAAARAVADGSGVVTDKVINAAVSKVAKEGATYAEKALLRQTIKESFEGAIKSELKHGARQWARGMALEVGSGFMGGFAGGITSGLFEWNPDLSFSENMTNVLKGAALSGAFGAGGAFAFSTTFKVAGAGIGKVAQQARLILSEGVPDASRILASPTVAAQQGDFFVVRATDAPAPSGKQVQVSADDLNGGKYQRFGESDFYLDSNGKVYKKIEDGAQGKTILAVDEHAALATTSSLASQIERARAADIAALGTPSKQTARDTGTAASRASGRVESSQVETHDVPEGALAMRGSKVQEEYWEGLDDDALKAELRSRFAGNQLFDPQPEAVYESFLDDIVRLKTNWRSLSEFGQLEDLQKAVNELTSELDPPLPNVEIMLKTLPEHLNGYYQDGVIVMNRRHWDANSSPNELVEATIHELSHVEQESMIIRTMIDDHVHDIIRKIYPEPDPIVMRKILADPEDGITRAIVASELNVSYGSIEHVDRKTLDAIYEKRTGKLPDYLDHFEVDAIRQEFRVWTGQDVSDDYVMDVFKLSKGRVLDDDARGRADKLAQSYLDATSARVGFDEKIQEYLAVRDVVMELEQGRPIDQVLRRLNRDPDFARKVLGPRFEEALEHFNQLLDEGSHTIVARFTMHVGAREGSLGLDIGSAVDDYARSYHELESWFIGRAAGNHPSLKEGSERVASRSDDVPNRPEPPVRSPDSVSHPKIMLDREGHIQSIRSRIGQTYFTYDKTSGDLRTISFGDRAEHVTEDGFNWYRKRPGKPPEWIQGKYEINHADGTLSWQEAGSRKKTVWNADGEQVVELAPILPPRNPIEEMSAPGGSITLDRSTGRVLKIKDASGLQTNFRYVGGELVGIVRSDGITLARSEQGNYWTETVPGQATLILRSTTFEVDARGTVWRRNARDITVGRQLDGTQAISVEGGPLFFRNPEGKIVKLTTPDGMVEYKYTDGGALAEVKDPKGGFVVPAGRGIWRVHDRNSTRKSYLIHGNLSVSDADGTLTWRAPGSNDATPIFELDDLRPHSLDQPSGSVTRDDQGRVSRLATPDGKTSDFFYGPGENEVRIIMSNGNSLHSPDGKTWYRFDGPGEPQRLPIDALWLDEHNSLVVRYSDQRVVAHELNGYTTIIERTGIGRRLDMQNRVVEIHRGDEVWELSHDHFDGLVRIRFDENRFAYWSEPDNWNLVTKHPLTGREGTVTFRGEFAVSEYGNLTLRPFGKEVPVDLPQEVKLLAPDPTRIQYVTADMQTGTRPATGPYALEQPRGNDPHQTTEPQDRIAGKLNQSRYLELASPPPAQNFGQAPGNGRIEIDAHDRIVRVVDDNGGETSFAYADDNPHELREIRRAGAVFTRPDGKTWYGPSGAMPGVEFRIDEDGILWQIMPNGMELGRRPDGAMDSIIPGRGYFHRSPQGLLLSHMVSRPDGIHVVTFDYSPDGNLNSVRYENGPYAGTVVTTTDNTNWVAHSAREPEKDFQFSGRVAVTDDGVVRWHDADGVAWTQLDIEGIRARHTAGHSQVEERFSAHRRWLANVNEDAPVARADSSIERNNGLVTRTVGDDGRTVTTYEYDKGGTLVGIQRSTGISLKKLDRAWHLTTFDGSDYLLHGREFTVDPENGTLYVMLPEGRVETEELSGAKTMQDSAGNGYKVDARGRVIESYKQGRIRALSYNADGQLDRIKLSDKSSAFRIDENTWGFVSRGGPHAPKEFQEFRGEFRVTQEGALEWRPQTSDQVPPDLGNAVTVVPPDQS